VDQAQLPPTWISLAPKRRIEWFLPVCIVRGVNGDTCTGDFYTLASCNPNGCGMPIFMRQAIAAKIDKGLTDRQISRSC